MSSARRPPLTRDLISVIRWPAPTSPSHRPPATPWLRQRRHPIPTVPPLIVGPSASSPTPIVGKLVRVPPSPLSINQNSNLDTGLYCHWPHELMVPRRHLAPLTPPSPRSPHLFRQLDSARRKVEVRENEQARYNGLAAPDRALPSLRDPCAVELVKEITCF
jgi:hypothetical protein